MERYFFSNFGPNSTTFILPSETFPTEAVKGRVGVGASRVCREGYLFE